MTAGAAPEPYLHPRDLEYARRGLINTVDADARIAYAGGPAPFELDQDAAAAVLDELL